MLHAPQHLVTFAIDICSRKLIIVTIFTSLLGQKFPEIRGPTAYTSIARALCTATTQVMHHRIKLVELYQFTKFHVASSKVPESKGAYANI